VDLKTNKLAKQIPGQKEIHGIAYASDSLRLQDRVAAEVAQALEQARSAADRLRDAEAGMRDAADTAAKSFEGLGQTRRAGNVILLVVRPQEAVAAVQALALAYADYFAAVGDHNRGQFRLYRALGRPARCVELPSPSPSAQVPADGPAQP
jgi:hypothetical protein